jgi:TolB-like protein
MDLAASLADRYRVDGELGRGGMAVVYRAHDLRHDRAVALKVLRPELAASLGADRFLREIRFAARLQHPHILPLLDSGELPAVPGVSPQVLWYAMPLVEGESLRDRLRRGGPQPVADVLRWGAELADALAYAHGHGVIHRDIKPENVLLSGQHVLLADFGVARALETSSDDRLTETGLALGTPAYMSPEQALADTTLDGRADLYSLGCVLYELLTGEPPYTGPTAQSVVAKRLSDPIPSARRLRETVPPALDDILQRLLAKSPADRFGGAAELGAALAGLPATTAGVAGAPSPAMPRPRTAVPPYRRPAVLLPLVLLLAASAAFLALRSRRREPAGPSLDPNTVAILPFRVTAPGHDLDYLAEGLVDLLAVKLDGSAGIHAVQPRGVLAAPGDRPAMGLSADAADAAARRAGAGMVLDGSLVRSAAGVELSATLRLVAGDGPAARGSAAGSLDSLPVLVDRLAAQLLAGRAGNLTTLGELSTTRAITEYLQGKTAMRRGRYGEAKAHYLAALREDSTFVLAAVELLAAANRPQDREAIALGERLGWAYRAKLTPAGRLLLTAWVGPKYPAPSSMIGQIAAWQEAAAAQPDLPEAWFELGDRQLHNGRINDLPHSVEQARTSFRRALELAPSWVAPLDHLILAQLDLDDTVGLRALAVRWLAQDTIPGDRSHYVRWRLGIALGDSAAAARAAAGLDRWSDDELFWLAGLGQAEAVGVADVERGIGEIERRAVAGSRRWNARLYRRDWLLNTGRPAAAAALTDSLASGEPFPGWAGLQRIDDALFSDGDTAEAAAEARSLAERLGSPGLHRARPGPGEAVRVRTICRLGFWAMGHGDGPGVRRWSARLRADRLEGLDVFNDDDRLMCADLLDAWLAWRERRPEARPLLDRTDSVYITSDVLDDWVVTNLVSARLREAIGDLPGAVRVIARVPTALPTSPTYRATYLREQARLGLQVGDTAGAVRALRRYVALRQQAEPALRPEVDRARGELARLLGR